MVTHLREWACSPKVIHPELEASGRRTPLAVRMGDNYLRELRGDDGSRYNLRVGSCFSFPFVSFCASVFFSSDPWRCMVGTNCFPNPYAILIDTISNSTTLHQKQKTELLQDCDIFTRANAMGWQFLKIFKSFD
jgi:hypothetical protein